MNPDFIAKQPAVYLFGTGYGSADDKRRIDEYFARHPEIMRGPGIVALVMRAISLDEAEEARYMLERR